MQRKPTSGVPARSAMPLGRVRALLDDVLVEMTEELDESATALSDAIHQACDGLEDRQFPATRQSTRANLGLITTLLAERSAPIVVTAPEEALSYARSYVHDGLSFELLTRVYHEGEHAYSRMWMDRLQAHASTAEELADSMCYFSDWLFGYITSINRPLSIVYTAEHERWIRGAIAMRSEEVRAILEGAQVDVTQSSGRLRYRLDGRHIGFVIWSDPVAHDSPVEEGPRRFDEMDRVAGEIAEQLGASSCLALPIGSYYAGWASVGADLRVDELPTASGGLRVALGRPWRGVAGFRRTHQEALITRRVASLSERGPGACLSFGAVALDALLTHDLDEARRFVDDEVGPLMRDSDAGRRLAATLEVFLHEESSYVRAGRRLGIHENTVAYRIRRAEELLGRDVADRQFELQAALRLAHFVSGDVQLPAG